MGLIELCHISGHFFDLKPQISEVCIVSQNEEEINLPDNTLRLEWLEIQKRIPGVDEKINSKNIDFSPCGNCVE